jgi:hypothetical protein
VGYTLTLSKGYGAKPPEAEDTTGCWMTHSAMELDAMSPLSKLLTPGGVATSTGRQSANHRRSASNPSADGIAKPHSLVNATYCVDRYRSGLFTGYCYRRGGPLALRVGDLCYENSFLICEKTPARSC